MAPDLVRTPDGRILLSWINRREGRRNVFQFSSYTETDGWQSQPRTIAIGNSLAGALSARMSAAGGESGLTVASALDGFKFSFWLLLGAGIVVLLVAPLINKLMHGVK